MGNTPLLQPRRPHAFQLCSKIFDMAAKIDATCLGQKSLLN